MKVRNLAIGGVVAVVSQWIFVAAGLMREFIPAVIIILAIAAGVRYFVTLLSERRAQALAVAPPSSGPDDVEVARLIVTRLREVRAQRVTVLIDDASASTSLFAPRDGVTRLDSPWGELLLAYNATNVYVAFKSASVACFLGGVLDGVGQYKVFLKRGEACELAGIVVRVETLRLRSDTVSLVTQIVSERKVRVPIRMVLAFLTAAEGLAAGKRGWSTEGQPAMLGRMTPENFARLLSCVADDQMFLDEVAGVQRTIARLVGRLSGSGIHETWKTFSQNAMDPQPPSSRRPRISLLEPYLALSPSAADDDITERSSVWFDALFPDASKALWEGARWRLAQRGGHDRQVAFACLALAVSGLILVDAVDASMTMRRVRERVSRAQVLRGAADEARPLVFLGDALRLVQSFSNRPVGRLAATKDIQILRSSFGVRYAREVVGPIAATMRRRLPSCYVLASNPTRDCVEAVSFLSAMDPASGVSFARDHDAQRTIAEILSIRWRDDLRARGHLVPPHEACTRAATVWLQLYGDDMSLRPRVSSHDRADRARALLLEGLLDLELDGIESRVPGQHREELVQVLQEGGSVFDTSSLPGTQYTIEAWTDEVSPEIAHAARSLTVRPWLVRPLLHGEADAARLGDLLTIRYFNRFERAWLDAMAGLRLRATQSEAELARLVNDLTNARKSPLDRLLCTIDRQTRPGDGPGAPAPRRTVVFLRNALWPPRPRAASIPPELALSLRRAFADAVSFALPAGERAPCVVAEMSLAEHSELRRYVSNLAVIADTVSRLPGDSSAMRSARQGIDEARRGLRLLARNGRSEMVVRLLDEPLRRLDAMLARHREDTISANYCTKVYEPLVRSQAYPIRFNARVGDVPLRLLRDVFSDDRGLPGILDSESGASLGNLHALEKFDPDFASFTHTVAPLRSALRDGLRFELTVTSAPDDVRRVEVVSGGSTVNCTRRDARLDCNAGSPVRWPHESLESHLTAWSEVNGTETEFARVAEHGEYSFWKLLEHAARHWVGPGTFDASFPTEGGGGSMTLRVHLLEPASLVGRDTSVALLVPLRQLRPPLRVFRDGTMCLPPTALISYEAGVRTSAVGSSGASHIWTPPGNVVDAGIAAHVSYSAAVATGDGEQLVPSAALIALRTAIVRNVRGVSSGGMVRNAARRGGPSQDPHRAGIAVDLMLHAGAQRAHVGDTLANMLVLNAEKLGLQYVIWSRYEWASSRGSRWEVYTGSDPHVDHVHVELGPDARTWDAARMSAVTETMFASL